MALLEWVMPLQFAHINKKIKFIFWPIGYITFAYKVIRGNSVKLIKIDYKINKA